MSSVEVPAGARWTGNVQRSAERLELVRGGGSVRVRGDEERAPAELDDVPGELGRRRRLARALEPDERDDRRVALQPERPIAGAQSSSTSSSWTIFTICWPAVRLPRISGADGLLADPPDDILDDLEVDVGLEQGQPDLARGRIDVRLADPAAAGQVGERLAQSIAEVVEHEGVLAPAEIPGEVQARRRAAGRHAGSGAPASGSVARSVVDGEGDALQVLPLRTRSANLPVAPAGISNRENRSFFVFFGPMSSTDWLWPSRRGATTFAVGQAQGDVLAGEREPAREARRCTSRRR